MRGYVEPTERDDREDRQHRHVTFIFIQFTVIARIMSLVVPSRSGFYVVSHLALPRLATLA